MADDFEIPENGRPGLGVRLTGRQLQTIMKRIRSADYDREDVWQFLGFAFGLARQSQAQLFQDLWALWRSGQRRGGYFVEVGAADGVRLSNTLFLERAMDWRGIVAEPNPRVHKALRANRRCHVSTKCVYSASGLSLDFLAADVGEFSKLASLPAGHAEGQNSECQEVKVETISLQDLLEEAGAPHDIDYLSVDTEGSELEILAAFDFASHNIAAITVEHNHKDIRAELYDLLTRQGYRRQWPELSRFDDWYVKDEGRA